MYDYKTWLSEAEKAVRDMARFDAVFEETEATVSSEYPLEVDALQQLIAEVDIFMPEELQRFWLEAASSTDCRYVLRGARGKVATCLDSIFGTGHDVYGEIFFSSPNDLPNHLEACRGWAAAFEEAPNPSQKAFWLNAVPFHSLLNGDYLALDVSAELADPPVVYLAHDDETSGILAPSFTSFLDVWAKLCYVGPEDWMLKPFRNENGLLDDTVPNAIRWQAFLGTDRTSSGQTGRDD